MGVPKNRTGLKCALGGSAALALAGGALLSYGVGSAAAVEARLSQTYECKFPLIGADPLKVAITAELPASIPVNTQTGAIRIDALSTVSARAAQGLGLVGAKSVEGIASASATVNLPGGDQLDVGLDTTVAKAEVPSPARDFDVKAAGAAPSLSFRRPGAATIDVNALTLKLTARDAAGKVVQLPPYGDVFEAPCALKPADQNKTLHRFTVTGADPTGPTPTAPTPTGPTPTGSTTTGPGPTGPSPTGPSPTGPGGTPGPTGTAGPGPFVPPPGTTGGTSGGTDLVTHVNGPGDGSLAGTGAAAAGWLLTGAGVLGAAGITAFHYAPRRIRGEGDDGTV
ncbi:DUF6801 domain-containing protein [Streptomyces melanogenes]|uniref:DUF6801 domain-containing protein n=1 Tax=Streptomyces melanogenes TaxID=67326 RepID=UPI00167CA505|nr:DUF6801 domain-containing protein [Streptomyces melanogenes]GGP57699.1 hypothetical protein GCM10010278_38230 [Streptomyces melanogenes]